MESRPRLLSVNVGLPRDIAWNGRTVHTGIWKDPVAKLVPAAGSGRLNLDGDGQGDLAGHGGEQRAVFVYQIESYRHWQAQLEPDRFRSRTVRRKLHPSPGSLTTFVCIGDRYEIGTALFWRSRSPG